jgi:hypothetical protein
MNNLPNTSQATVVKNELAKKVHRLEDFMDANAIRIVGPDQRDQIIKNFYDSDAKKANIVLCTDLEFPGWIEPGVIKATNQLDLTQGGILLIERYYDNPEYSEKGFHDLYTLDRLTQLIKLREYLAQIKLDATAVLIGNAQKQIVIFGDSALDYIVTSNF